MESDGIGRGSSYRYCPNFVRDVGYTPSIEVNARPDLEIHEREQLVGAVDAIRVVRGHEVRDGRFAEDSAPPKRRGRQYLTKHRLEVALEPRSHRRAEPALSAVEDSRRKNVSQRRLHHVLEAPAPHLHRF